MKRLLATLAFVLAFSACGIDESGIDEVRQGLDVSYTNNYGVISIAGNVLCHPEVPTDQTTCPYLVFWRDDNTCQAFSLSNVVGSLQNSITIYSGTQGGAGWANMRAVESGHSYDVYCSNTTRGVWHFMTLQQNGNTVTMHGTGAADYMGCSGSGGPVVCFGLGGNDIMEDWNNTKVDMYGGDGDDKLRILTAPISNSYSLNLFGQNGNDCLYSPITQTSRDCGAGTDTSNASGWGCETVTQTTCP